MRPVFFDTSVLVAALLNEPLGSSARRAIDVHRETRPLVNDWVLTEFASAMGLKVRRRDVPASIASDAIAFLDRLVSANFELVAVERAHFRTAAGYCARFDVGLRGPDALHLAVAHERDAVLLTLDDKLSRAASALNLKASLIA